MRKRFIKNQRGAALLETAITLPLILLVSVAIFEFGRAYQTWQVLTNAAREGARVSIINGTSVDDVKAAVKTYAEVGGLAVADEDINVNQFKPLGADWTSSEITVAYPFDFIVLNPVAQMVAGKSKLGEPLTMTAVAVMRNES